MAADVAAGLSCRPRKCSSPPPASSASACRSTRCPPASAPLCPRSHGLGAAPRPSRPRPFPKSTRYRADGAFTVGGTAKGSGMIRPNMATIWASDGAEGRRSPGRRCRSRRGTSTRSPSMASARPTTPLRSRPAPSGGVDGRPTRRCSRELRRSPRLASASSVEARATEVDRGQRAGRAPRPMPGRWRARCELAARQGRGTQRHDLWVNRGSGRRLGRRLRRYRDRTSAASLFEEGCRTVRPAPNGGHLKQKNVQIV